MFAVSIQKLKEEAGSIFQLTLLAARRAQQLNEGAPRLVESQAAKISTVALEEIAQGKVKL